MKIFSKISDFVKNFLYIILDEIWFNGSIKIFIVKKISETTNINDSSASLWWKGLEFPQTFTNRFDIFH